MILVLIFLLLTHGICLGLDICEWQEDGTYLAHPADCAKFVLCFGGMTAVIENCPIGFHFNRQLGICDYRVKAGCEQNYVLETVSSGSCCCCCSSSDCNLNYPTEAPPTTKKPCNEQTTESTTCSTMESTTGSTIECTTESIIESTTESIIESTMCSTMESTIESTTQSTTETTTEPTTTKATTVPTTPPTIESTTGTSSPTPTQFSTTASSQKQNNPLCGNNLPYCYNFIGVRNILYPGDCGKYIVCIDGCATVKSCPSNLHFNPSYGYCDLKKNVDCPYKEIEGALVCPSERSCQDPGKCALLPEGTMLRDPDSNGFIICQCECEVKKDCPFGFIYNEELQVCDWPVKSIHISMDCDSSSSSICANQTDGSLFPVEGACHKFYGCLKSCAYELQCPDNLIFNATHKFCDNPEYTTCNWPYRPDFGAKAGPCGIACEAAGRCVGQPEGILLESLNATDKYVVCQCECEVEMNCPKGLIFDNFLQLCDVPKTLK